MLFLSSVFSAVPSALDFLNHLLDQMKTEISSNKELSSDSEEISAPLSFEHSICVAAGWPCDAIVLCIALVYFFDESFQEIKNALLICFWV